MNDRDTETDRQRQRQTETETEAERRDRQSEWGISHGWARTAPLDELRGWRMMDGGWWTVAQNEETAIAEKAIASVTQPHK